MVPEKVILEIAQKYFSVETLEVKNRDSLDFYDVHVMSIKRALEEAYNLGLKKAIERGQ